MSKTIKLDNPVYNRLQGILVGRETFSHGVDRLLKLWDMMGEVADTLGPAHFIMGKSPHQEATER